MVIQQSQVAQFHCSNKRREVNLEVVGAEELLGRKNSKTESSRDQVDEDESGVVISNFVGGLGVVGVLGRAVPESESKMTFGGSEVELVKVVTAEVVAVSDLLTHWVLF